MSKPDREKRIRARNDGIVDGPIPFTLRGPDGQSRELLLSRHGPAELMAMRRWIRGILEPKAKGPALPFSREELDLLTDKEKAVMLKTFATERARIGKSNEIQISPEEALELALSPEGIARMVWLAARRYQPAITLEEITPLITEVNVPEVSEAYGKAMTTEDDDPKTNRPSSSPATSAARSVGPKSTGLSGSTGE